MAVNAVIASYNMSFASDLGKVIGSEANFLSRVQKHYSGSDPRTFWNNAKEHVKKFCSEKKPTVLGFQEMNFTPAGSSTGTAILMKELKEINANLVPITYTIDVSAFQKPTVLTMFDKDILGDVVSYYGADIPDCQPEGTYNVNVMKAPNDAGRPILIILTKKGYFLVNIHGPNQPDDSLKNNSNKLRNAIESHFNKAIVKFGSPQVDYNKVFVLGDFNDPHNAINTTAPLKINGNDFTPGADGVRSCCYNWNSACKQELRKTDGTKDCPVPEPMPKAQSLSDPPGEEARGTPATYIFTGDYCLGKNITEPLAIYPSPVGPDGSSIASDHELVYATFNISASGGARRRRLRYTKRAKDTHTRRSKSRRTPRRSLVCAR